MANNRQLRLLVAPFFFILSLLVGLFFEDECGNRFTAVLGDNGVALLGVIVTASVPLGFFINQVSIGLLSLFFGCSRHCYEVWLGDETLRKMCGHTSLGGSPKGLEELDCRSHKVSELYIDLSFRHGELSHHRKGMFEWFSRVWSSFMTCTNTAVAILLSGVVGVLVFDMPVSSGWWWFMGIVLLANVLTGIALWFKSMTMSELEVMRWDPHERDTAVVHPAITEWVARRELAMLYGGGIILLLFVVFGCMFGVLRPGSIQMEFSVFLLLLSPIIVIIYHCRLVESTVRENHPK